MNKAALNDESRGHGAQVRSLTDAVLASLGLAVAIAMMLDFDVSMQLVSLCIIFLSFYCVFAVAKNRMLLLVYGVIAWANYSICVGNYLLPLSDTLATSLRDTSEAAFAMSLLLLFMSILTALLPRHINGFGFGDRYFAGFFESGVLVVVLICVLCFICVFGFVRPASLGGDRGSPSSLYEYSIILFILAIFFSGEKRWAKLTILAIMAVFAFQNIAYGGRIVALQLLFIAFFLLFSHKVKNSLLVAGAIICFIFFAGFGGVRTAIWDEGFSAIFEVFLRILDGGLTWDTAISAWHTSITFVLYQSLISASENLYLFGQWVLSIFFGSSNVPDSVLASITIGYYPHSYGGVLPIYIWFYFGILGVAIIASITSFLMRKINGVCHPSFFKGGYSSSLVQLCLLYVVVTVPRWYLYSPSQLTRGLLLMLIASSVALLVHRLATNRAVKGSS